MIRALSLTKLSFVLAALATGCINEEYMPEEAAEALGEVPAQESEEQEFDQDFVDALSELPKPVEGGVDAEITGVETLDVTIPKSLHGQGLAIPAKLVRPKWSKAVGKRPAMMVLHGSGGLFKMPGKDDEGVCSDEMEKQFVTWANRLAEMGYTVLLPSSYSPRGFCDKHVDFDKAPKTFDEKTEQIVSRVYDFDAAARYLCDRPEVDCDRMGLLGFSQGATMVMMALHWQLDHAITTFRQRHGDKYDIEIPDLKPGRPDFQVGIAYYPGCGFDGVIPTTTDSDTPITDKYLPTAPLTILHGTEDPLIKHCSADHGPGARELQAEQLTKKFKIFNTYGLKVYKDAAHSFDSNDKGGEATGKGDVAAKKDALKVTLAQLVKHL
jgi:dienelactone hydrolase